MARPKWFFYIFQKPHVASSSCSSDEEQRGINWPWRKRHQLPFYKGLWMYIYVDGSKNSYFTCKILFWDSSLQVCCKNHHLVQCFFHWNDHLLWFGDLPAILLAPEGTLTFTIASIKTSLKLSPLLRQGAVHDEDKNRNDPGFGDHHDDEEKIEKKPDIFEGFPWRWSISAKTCRIWIWRLELQNSPFCCSAQDASPCSKQTCAYVS